MCQVRTNPAGTAVTEVLIGHDGADETCAAASCGLVRRRQLGPAAPDFGQRQASEGLANGSDQVGRNYMCHNSPRCSPSRRSRIQPAYQKTLGLNDFYFEHGRSSIFRSAGCRWSASRRRPCSRGEADEIAKLAPLWSLETLARHAVDFWLTTEDLPRSDNRVTLESDGGIRLSSKKSNQVPSKKLYQKLKSILGQLGMHPDHLIPRNLYLKNEMDLGAVSHQAGTCRFGADPATSVLDVNCKAHELDNLYVVDTSFFPSIGAVNPGLTAMANALRVGDHLRRRLR